MPRTQAKIVEEQDETQRCLVVSRGIENGRRDMALEFSQFYSKERQQELLDEHVPKRLHETFMENVALWSSIELKRSKRA